MVTHVVMWRFRDRDPGQLAHHRALLEGLPAQVPEIRHFEVGVNAVESERNWDMCLYSRFDSIAGLSAYQVHPAHVEVATYLRAAAELVAVVDYQS